MNRDVLGYIAMFGLLMMVSVIGVIMLWGVNHDYIFYNVNNVSRTLEGSGTISSDIANSIEDVANSHADFINYMDWFWLLAYLMFLGSSVSISYLEKDEDEFSFLGLLFYGIMALLFVFFVLSTLTEWFQTDVLYQLIPNIEGNMPKFEYWTANAGMFTFIHLLVCIFANKISLNIVEKFKKKDNIGENEVL